MVPAVMVPAVMILAVMVIMIIMLIMYNSHVLFSVPVAVAMLCCMWNACAHRFVMPSRRAAYL